LYCWQLWLTFIVLKQTNIRTWINVVLLTIFKRQKNYFFMLKPLPHACKKQRLYDTFREISRREIAEEIYKAIMDTVT
jgi:hypothetical protein